MKTHDYIILGAGLAGLLAACRLIEAGERDVAIVADGFGGTPYIAAFNAVLDDNPHGDSIDRYVEDMLRAGYGLGDRALIERTARLTGEVVEILERWGVEFAREDGGGYALRHASGSSVPRSLCRKDLLVGQHVVDVLVPELIARGAAFYRGACVRLLTQDGRIAGITMLDKATGMCGNLYTPRVLAAWGGVGRLYAESTYPGDVDGRGPAMASEAGAALLDLEFVEFEPMVAYEPPAARGEPCPTAMLGEGATLLNAAGERFLLSVRPQGEAGAPKTLINDAIEREVAAGRGTELGGAYVDLRMIPQQVLEAYPWFYFRLRDAGLDVKKQLLQVGPMAHSHSGGMAINLNGMTNVGGLFAAGEAAAGMHGACRMAGNAAAQAAASGLLAADGMLNWPGAEISEQPVVFAESARVRAAFVEEIGEICMEHIARRRDGEGLRRARARLEEICALTKEDTFAHQMALSALLLAVAALAREESRGTHIRTDFPSRDERFDCSLQAIGTDIKRVERGAR